MFQMVCLTMDLPGSSLSGHRDYPPNRLHHLPKFHAGRPMMPFSHLHPKENASAWGPLFLTAYSQSQDSSWGQPLQGLFCNRSCRPKGSEQQEALYLWPPKADIGRWNFFLMPPMVLNDLYIIKCFPSFLLLKTECIFSSLYIHFMLTIGKP